MVLTPPSPHDDYLESEPIDEIDVAECWRLLSTQPIGRVAVIVKHYPLVYPVNYVLDGRHILFRTNSGTKLWATARSNVTFEVDDIDVESRSGWSVMIRGAAQEVGTEKNPWNVVPSTATEIKPWAPGRRDHVVRIVTDQITGRRIRPGELLEADPLPTPT